MAVAKKKILGWREWVELPGLKVGRIKAKLDTGARTSALHAFNVTPYTKYGAAHVKFDVHPVQRKKKPSVRCRALVIDHRTVTNSGGVREERPVIRTKITVGKDTFPIEMTLTDRDEMGFRLLLGRQALRRRFIVDPARAFAAGKKKKKSGSKK